MARVGPQLPLRVEDRAPQERHAHERAAGLDHQAYGAVGVPVLQPEAELDVDAGVGEDDGGAATASNRR